jgi:hypothetical protein
MVDRWTVERAVRESALDPPGRQLILTLLTWADHDTAMIPAAYTPSLTTLAKATGLSRSTVKTWLNLLEVVGWVARWRPDPQAAHRVKARTRYALRVPPRSARSPSRPSNAIGNRPGGSTPTGGEPTSADPTGSGAVPDACHAAARPTPEPPAVDMPADGSTRSATVAAVGPPPGPTRSDTSDMVGPSSGPTTSGISDMTRPPGGPTESDMPDIAGPLNGPTGGGVGPTAGPIMSGMPDMIGPLSGLKPYKERTNRVRTPAHPHTRTRERPAPTVGLPPPVAAFGRVGDHRYVEGVNGYCAVAGCRRSAPLHAAQPPTPQQRQPTP